MKNNTYIVKDQKVRKDFYDLMGMSVEDNDEHVERMYSDYIRLTKNDNNLKTRFLMLLDELWGDIEYTLIEFRNIVGIPALM